MLRLRNACSTMLLCLAWAADIEAAARQGRVVDTAGQPVARAEVSIVGLRGSARTDMEGRFTWPGDLVPPFVAVIVLPDGRVAPPVPVDRVGPDGQVILRVEAAFTETVVVSGVAPAIDVAGPAASTLVGRTDLALRHPITVAQALDTVPGAWFLAEGQGAVPSLRGLARGRTLVLLDGLRVASERRAGPSASFVDPATLRRIDVVRGPGSVAYGSDAFGGVIALGTSRPDRTDPLHIRLQGSLAGGVPERRAAIDVSTGWGRGALLLSARTRDVDDYRSPEGTVANSSWRDAGIRLRWEQDAGRATWSVGWQSDVGRDLGRPRSDSDVLLASSPFENVHRLSVSFESAAGGFARLRVDGMLGRQDERVEQDRLANPQRPRSVTRADVSANDLQVRVTAERTLGRARIQLGGDVHARFGLQAEDATLSFDRSGALRTVAVSRSIESAAHAAVGVYAQADLPVAARARLSTGVRVDGVRSRSRGGFFGRRAVSTGAMAGFGAITLGPFARTELTVQLARGFRDPTLSDRFYRGPVGRGFIEGNPDLRPETSWQLDAGLRYQASRASLGVAFYHYRLTNLVERYAAGSDLFRFRNRGEARLRGVEVEVSTEVGRGLSAVVTAQASRGRAVEGDAPLDDVAPRQAAVIIRHAAGTRVSSYLRLARVAPHQAAGPSEVPTPGYTMLDAGAVWLAPHALEMHVTARNLLNARHHASAGPRWVLAPGRQVSVTFVAGF